MDDDSPSETKGERLTARFVWNEVLDFLSFERGALYTFVHLCRHPGKTIRRYLDGHRQKLTNPVRLLLMSCAIATAAYVFILPPAENAKWIEKGFSELREPEQEEVAEKLASARGALEEVLETAEESHVARNSRRALDVLDRSLAEQMSEIMATWMNVFLLFALPINTVLTWICFRKAKLNIAEHVVTNAYIQAVQNLVSIIVPVFAAVGWVGIGTGSAVYMLSGFAYQFVVWRQVFNLRGFVQSLLSVAALIASVIGFLVLEGMMLAILTLFTA